MRGGGGVRPGSSGPALLYLVGVGVQLPLQLGQVLPELFQAGVGFLLLLLR